MIYATMSIPYVTARLTARISAGETHTHEARQGDVRLIVAHSGRLSERLQRPRPLRNLNGYVASLRGHGRRLGASDLRLCSSLAGRDRRRGGGPKVKFLKITGT
jgi:hypothetical protein